MRILFVHHRFPGQFLHWARYLYNQPDVEIRALCARSANTADREMWQDFILEYEPASLSSTADSHALKRTLQATANSYNCMLSANALKESGWVPDIIYSHTGWADSVFLREIYPNAKIIKYLEWYYNTEGSDADFLEGYTDIQERLAVKVMNFPILADIIDGDSLISPTEWQKKQFPSMIRSSIDVVPDGIDTDYFKADEDAKFVLDSGRILTRSDRIVTYATRGADPYRGFQSFIRALEKLQAADKRVEAIISGDRMVHYGPGAGTNRHFEQVMATSQLDIKRTHFVGFLPLRRHLSMLQVSKVHVYLTVPFVLSWSLLEAMSVGCAIVASDTAPVKEFLCNGKNGRLVDFFDAEAISTQVRTALDAPDIRQSSGKAARDTVKHRWGLDIAIKRHIQRLDETLAGTPMTP